MGFFVPYEDGLYILAEVKGKENYSFWAVQAITTSNEVKWILVSHSPQHDLPQFSDPQVPPANSKLSQLQAWTPSQWSLFSLVLPILDVWHWTPTKLFLSIQNLSSMLQCHVAMKWVWILQSCFRWFILWTSEFHHSFLGSSSKSYNWGRVHFYLQFLQK